MGPSGSLLHYILYVFMSLCLRGVNIDQSEHSLLNVTNQLSDCENSNSGQEASHNII